MTLAGKVQLRLDVATGRYSQDQAREFASLVHRLRELWPDEGTVALDDAIARGKQSLGRVDFAKLTQRLLCVAEEGLEPPTNGL